VSKLEFSYVTYIATTPEALWNALTLGELTSRYWFGRRVESHWRVGSDVRFYDMESDMPIDRGEVLVADAPRRLSYTWHVEFDAEMRRERPSRLTFDLEPLGDVVRLSVTHEDFEPGSRALAGITRGWPAILSSLKTLLETGKPLAIPAPPSDARRERPRA